MEIGAWFSCRWFDLLNPRFRYEALVEVKPVYDPKVTHFDSIRARVADLRAHLMKNGLEVSRVETDERCAGLFHLIIISNNGGGTLPFADRVIAEFAKVDNDQIELKAEQGRAALEAIAKDPQRSAEEREFTALLLKVPRCGYSGYRLWESSSKPLATFSEIHLQAIHWLKSYASLPRG